MVSCRKLFQPVSAYLTNVQVLDHGLALAGLRFSIQKPSQLCCSQTT
jgi:hypothetical protein